MAMKDISDLQVLQACRDWRCIEGATMFADGILKSRTGQPEKVIFRCLERAVDRGLLDYGVSLRTAWLPEKGEMYLAENTEGSN